jgi:RNA-directed DNA polymerase
MEREMRELYIEGVAIHGGPESCAVVREGGGEALTGVRAGWAIEPRNQGVRGADAVKDVGRQHRQPRYRELLAGPARSKNLCMYGISMCENREIPCSPVPPITGWAAQGRLRSYA